MGAVGMMVPFVANTVTELLLMVIYLSFEV